MATYTDQMEVHGKTVWFDLLEIDKIADIEGKSENWLDFITGINQIGYTITALPNGTYQVDKKSSTTRLTLRLPEETYGRIWKIHTETRKSINSIIIDLINNGLE